MPTAQRAVVRTKRDKAWALGQRGPRLWLAPHAHLVLLATDKDLAPRGLLPRTGLCWEALWYLTCCRDT